MLISLKLCFVCLKDHKFESDWGIMRGSGYTAIGKVVLLYFSTVLYCIVDLHVTPSSIDIPPSMISCQKWKLLPFLQDLPIPLRRQIPDSRFYCFPPSHYCHSILHLHLHLHLHPPLAITN